MKIFRMNDIYSVICNSISTRYGFKHVANLMRNGVELDEAKVCYYNRTWEHYEYETVIQVLLDKTNELTDKEKKRFRNKINRR